MTTNDYTGPRCTTCSEPATCITEHDDRATVYQCDDCCLHRGKGVRCVEVPQVDEARDAQGQL